MEDGYKANWQNKYDQIYALEDILICLYLCINKKHPSQISYNPFEGNSDASHWVDFSHMPFSRQET